jgi:hypothetical protein
MFDSGLTGMHTLREKAEKSPGMPDKSLRALTLPLPKEVILFPKTGLPNLGFQPQPQLTSDPDPRSPSLLKLEDDAPDGSPI